MKFYFFVFLFGIFISISLVSASFSLAPGKLYFDMNNNKKICQKIVLISDDYKGKVKLRDVWTGVDEDYNINKFYMKAKDFGLDVSYPKTIAKFKDRESIEICLSGNNIKEGKGALIFTPESDTNIVVEVGAWLFVEGESFNPPSYEEVNGGGGAGESNVLNVNEENNREELDEELSQDFESNQKPMATVEEGEKGVGRITGAVVGAGKNNWEIIVIVLLIVVIGWMFVNQKNKRD